MPRRNGFSLIELMVASAVVGLVTFYMLGGVIASNRAYTVVDQVAETQQGMRAIAELIERDLRHGGMMVPTSAAVCAFDGTGAADILYVSDATAIDPSSDFVPYAGARLPAATTNVTLPSDTFAVDSLVLEPSPPTRAAYDTDNDGTMDSDFRVGGGAIVTDLDDPTRGTACGRVTAVNLAGPTITVAFATPALSATAGATQLVAIPAHEYRLENGDQILRDGKLLSEGVDDLQIAFFLDANDDGIIDAGEMAGVPGRNFSAQGTDISLLREVRVNLVVRTRGEDATFDGREQQWENRTGATPADGFRRRTYTSTVRLRNMVDRVGT